MLSPDLVAGNAGGDWRQLMGVLALVNAVAAPIVAFGGFLAGFFVLSGNRENGRSVRLDWMIQFGGLAGAIYGALTFLLISQSGSAFAIGACAGAVSGLLSGAIWCLMVERPRDA
jgi:hypothetical protein